MDYYVVADDGARYGPADEATLHQWLVEARVRRDTVIHDALGERTNIATVLHLPPLDTYGQPAPGMAAYPRYASTSAVNPNNVFWSSIAFSIVSLACLPIVFGPLAIVYAYKAKQAGHELWGLALGLAILFMVIGFGAGVFFFLLNHK